MGCGPQSGRPDTEKVRFYDEMASEWDFESSSEIIVSSGHFKELWGNVLKVLKVYMGGMVLEKCRRKKVAEFCDERAVRGKHLVL